MSENPLESIFLKVRDQYSAAVRWSYFAVILLLFFHLLSIGPFIELNRQKTQTERDKERLSGVEMQIAALANDFNNLNTNNLSELDQRLNELVQDLRKEFKRLDTTIKELREKAKIENDLLPEKIKLLIPPDLREFHEAILQANKIYKTQNGVEENQKISEEVKNSLRKKFESPDFRKSIESQLKAINIPMFRVKDINPQHAIMQQALTEESFIQKPLFQITDPSLLKKVKFAENRHEMLQALKPFVEAKIIKPEYLKLNEDWDKKILPEIQKQFVNLKKEIESAKSEFPEGLDLWGDLLTSLETSNNAASNLNIEPPPDPPYWWSTVVGKEKVRIALKKRVASQLQKPPALKTLRKHVLTLISDQKKLSKEIQIESAKLEQQFKDQQEKLASLAQPLKFIALELNSIMVLFPLLLGLIFAALSVWTTIRLYDLGQITNLLVKQGAGQILWDWYRAQVFLSFPKPSMDTEEQMNSSLIRKSVSYCAVVWIWIGVVTWRLHGIKGIEPGHLILVTCIGATVIAFAQIHRYFLLKPLLSQTVL